MEIPSPCTVQVGAVVRGLDGQLALAAGVGRGGFEGFEFSTMWIIIFSGQVKNFARHEVIRIGIGVSYWNNASRAENRCASRSMKLALLRGWRVPTIL